MGLTTQGPLSGETPLPPAALGPVIVREDEPSSIIAYTLCSEEYDAVNPFTCGPVPGAVVEGGGRAFL